MGIYSFFVFFVLTGDPAENMTITGSKIKKNNQTKTISCAGVIPFKVILNVNYILKWQY